MRRHHGASLTESIVVLVIIAIMLGMLLPAIQIVRERARETQCKSRLRQIYLAMNQLVGTTGELPPKSVPNVYGGWMVEILPFMEQGNLRTNIPDGQSIRGESEFDRPPALFVCPTRFGLDETYEAMWPAHYVLVTSERRKSYSLYEAPVDLHVAWASSPELRRAPIGNAKGPHQGRFYYIQSELHGVQVSN